MIDLRSDTVTKPTPAMQRAMAAAEVGDDVYGEDPTVNRLEERAAEIAGKEAALFVPSGTMGNTIAIKLHTEHGQEVVCEARSHVFNYELAMMAWFCGCLARPVPSNDGITPWSDLRPHIKGASPHFAPSALVCVENTHNMGGGTVYPMHLLTEVCDRSHELGLRVHMDGARVFNASVYLGIPVSRIVARADTVMFCLSKGLCAPVGSMLAGSSAAISRARHFRKRLGGAMRQAGVLAAAGLIALEDMPGRLAQDHENARYLASAIANIPGLTANVPATNIVIMSVARTGMDAPQFSARLKERGVAANAIGPESIRLLTHNDVSRADCEQAAALIESVATAGRHTVAVSN